MRPRRVPGVRGSGVGGRGASRAPSPEPPAPEGSDFTEVLRVDMRPLLHPHRMQRRPRRHARCDALPQIYGEGFSGREAAARRELGDSVVDHFAVEPRRDLVAQYPIQLAEVHHAFTFRLERPSDRHVHLIAVGMIGRRLSELGRIPVCAPIGPLDTVRRRKLNDTRKIADRHGQNTRTALALNENTTGLPGASARSRTASSVMTATSSTPTSAVTWTAPSSGRRRARPVTRPGNVLRAEEASGSRLTKISVGGTARIAGPVLSVMAAISTVPTQACFKSP